MNLTPEYPPEVKPERVGVYKTCCGQLQPDRGYSHWNGYLWGPQRLTVEAAEPWESGSYAYQNKHWQGLAEDPGKRADDTARLDWLFAHPLEALDIIGRHRQHEARFVRSTIDAAIEALKETTP